MKTPAAFGASLTSAVFGVTIHRAVACQFVRFLFVSEGTIRAVGFRVAARRFAHEVIEFSFPIGFPHSLADRLCQPVVCLINGSPD